MVFQNITPQGLDQLSGDINSLVEYSGLLYAGGNWNGVPYIVSYQNNAWTTRTGGDLPAYSGILNSLNVVGGDLYACGSDVSSSSVISFIVRYQNGTWVDYYSDVLNSNFPDYPSSKAWACSYMDDATTNYVIVCGEYTIDFAIGPQPYVYIWNGSWYSMNDGSLPGLGRATCMKRIGDNVFIGGYGTIEGQDTSFVVCIAYDFSITNISIGFFPESSIESVSFLSAIDGVLYAHINMANSCMIMKYDSTWTDFSGETLGVNWENRNIHSIFGISGDIYVSGHSTTDNSPFLCKLKYDTVISKYRFMNQAYLGRISTITAYNNSFVIGGTDPSGNPNISFQDSSMNGYITDNTPTEWNTREEGYIQNFESTGNILYASGADMSGNIPITLLASYINGSWNIISGCPVDRSINHMTHIDNVLYICGSIRQTYSSVPIFKVVSYENGEFTDCAFPYLDVYGRSIYSFVDFSGILYTVGSSTTYFGAGATSELWEYSGGSWQNILSSSSPISGILTSIVSMEGFGLVVGGFISSNAIDSPYVFCYVDGGWVSILFGETYLNTSYRLSKLYVIYNTLYAVLEYFSAIPWHVVLKMENGSWSELSGGDWMPEGTRVRTMCGFNDKLYVYADSNGLNARTLMVYENDMWITSTIDISNKQIWAMCSFNDTLFLGGAKHIVSDNSEVSYSTFLGYYPSASPPPPVPCFLANAPVLTPTGYVKIAKLKKGDLVTTGDGRHVAIQKIKHTVVEAGPEVNPYIIPKGMYGSNKRLLISPNHRVQTKKGMIEARKLGLEQEEMTGQFDYYNLELPSWKNDTMVVAGVTVESMAPVRRMILTPQQLRKLLLRKYGTITPEVFKALLKVSRILPDGRVDCPVMSLSDM